MEEYPVPEDVLFGEYFRVLPVVLSCKTTVLMPNSLAYEIVLTENDSIKEDEEINLAEVLLNSLLAAGTMSAANAVKDITNVDNNAIAGTIPNSV